MTKLEVILENKKCYEVLMDMTSGMSLFEKAVAKNLTAKLFKGHKWLGGLSDAEANKEYEKLAELGYAYKAIQDEFVRQYEAVYAKIGD